MINNYQGTPYHDEQYPGGTQQIPGKIMCAYYDMGGEGVAYHDSDAVNHGSGELNPIDGSYLHSFRVDEGVDTSYVKYKDTIDNSPYNLVQPEENMLYVGWTVPGEWTKYTVTVAEAGIYTVDLLYTSFQGGAVSIAIDDEDVTGPIAITSPYREEDPIDWRQYHHWNIAQSMAEITLTAGQHTLTLHTVENGNMNYAYLAFAKK